MSKDPAILFYSSDFLAISSDLTMLERGQLITLFCLQHQKGHLSNKIIDLSIGINDVSADVLHLFSQDDKGLYFNEWLEEIILKRKAYTESRSKNRKGKTKTYEKHMKFICNSYEKHMENRNENINLNTNINEYTQ